MWPLWARPQQLAPPGNWATWLILAGRGFGKTRSGAEWVREQVERHGKRRIALIGPTAADVRDVMVEGESGILSISPPWFRPKYEPSKRRLTWPNGAIATCFSADEPDRLRGPQHDAIWADELAAWKYPDYAWDMAQMGLRLGDDPRAIVTTTPRPIQIIRDLIADPGTVVTRGSTFDNRENLAERFLNQILTKYEGTRIGRQELYGEILDDVPGALWTLALLDSLRINKPSDIPEMKRIVVAIDPAVTSTKNSDETGIVVAGLGVDGRGYVLEDLSGRFSANDWGKRAIEAYHRWQADCIVAEVNHGGDLVESLLRTIDANVPIKQVRASRGKAKRAEPVAALYEQGKVSHVGAFKELENEMIMTTPAGTEGHDDRVDALVWALTELMLVDNDPDEIIIGWL